MLWLSRLVVSDFCDCMDCSLPGSSVHVISYSRILEWVAIFFSRGSSRPRGIELISLMSPALESGFFTTEPPGKPDDPLQGSKKSHLNSFRTFYFWFACGMCNKDDTIILIGFLESLNHGSLQCLTQER